MVSGCSLFPARHGYHFHKRRVAVTSGFEASGSVFGGVVRVTEDIFTVTYPNSGQINQLNVGGNGKLDIATR